MSYAPYPAYKDSGVPWLGHVPEEWMVAPLRRFLRVQSGDIISKDKETDEGVPIYGGNGIRGYTDEPNTQGPLILIGRVGAHCGNVHIAQGPLWASEHAFRVYKNQPFEIEFFAYLIESLNLNQFAIRTAQPLLNSSIVAEQVVSVPSIEEQTAIADFLDKKTAEIDDLIAKKEELLRLLAEQRTALITHAVTKGLNPNAPMKPSGIDWLGDVPEGWEVKPLKFLGRFQNGISIGGDSFGSGFPFVSYGDVYKNLSLPETGSGLVESTAKDRVLYSVEHGDIFFTRTSETIEEIAISSVCETTIPDAVFAGFLIRCRPYPKRLDVGFSKYYFRNSRLRDYFVKEMNLVTRASLGQTLLGNLMVALPPLDEQEHISVFLDEKLEDLAKVEADTRTSIRLLNEYRTSIITSAVTGKIKVA
ncbi:restriction endonuclease subunit S [Shimia sp. CNT1-13L.2]|uniref:restriction endonuclease subunit S n=1 Tax=Shimia sp. CNT1-13L.2 TaxID=2959663 RepID=UPI0020CF8BF1|nr:restriction endonuclease subunit S [Shimia sp. CNT1-13L.2]MCP9481148.1 restriction endonuclease subunit S [Shimia sp. CNT1-13L.2]